MTDTTIPLSLDDSAITAGAQRVQRTLADLGKNVNANAKTAGDGIAHIGDGGDEAAGKIDRASKQIINAIQRQTAVIEGGDKANAHYWSSLGNARGVDPNLLKPYLVQLQEAAVRAQLAADANHKFAESTRFLDTLKNQADTIGKTNAQLLEMKAAQLGVSQQAAPLIARLAEAEKGVGGVGVSAAQTAAAMRQLPAQFTDIITSLQGGQKPLTVLMQQGGQIKDSFGGVGNALKATGGYLLGMVNPATLAAVAIGAVAVGYHEGAMESVAFQKALINSGNALGIGTEKLAGMRNEIAQLSGGTRGFAAEVLGQMVQSARFGVDGMEKFAAAAIRMERVSGKAASETVSEFAELSKSPLEALVRLDDKYHFLTASTYAQVKALKDQGKASEAAKVAQEAYYSVMDNRGKSLEANLGSLERAWLGIKETAKGAWDAMLNIGREQSLDDKLRTVEKRIEMLRADSAMLAGNNARQSKLKNGVKNVMENAELQRALDERDDIQQQRRLAGSAAQNAEARRQHDERQRLWMQDSDKYLTTQQSYLRERNKIQEEGKAAGISPDEIKSRVARLDQSNLDRFNAPYLARLEGDRAKEREILSGRLEDIESLRKRELITETEYYQRKEQLQLQDLDKEIAATKARRDRARGKEDQSEYIRLNAELQVLEEKRLNIKRASLNEQAQIEKQRADLIKNQKDNWARANEHDEQALKEEIALYGKSAEAQKILAAQLKVEAEARAFIDEQKRNKKPLNEAEIADLYKQVEARKQVIGTVMAQQQALQGANQLREQNKRFGAELIWDEKAKARYLLEVDADMWRERIKLAGDGTEAQKLLQEEFTQWYSNQVRGVQLKEDKAMWESIEKAAHDAFLSIEDGGKSAMQRLRDSIKTGFFDWLYQMTVKPFILNIGATISGASMTAGPGAAMSAGGFGGGGGAGGMGALLNGASLFNGASSMFSSGNAGTGFFGSMLGGMRGAGTGSGLESEIGLKIGEKIAGLPSMLKSVAPIAQNLGMLYMANQLGKSISGGLSVGPFGSNGLVNTGTALFGVPGAIVSGLINRAFGMGEKQTTGQTVSGSFGADGTLNASRNVAWHQDGGWFRGSRDGVWSYNLANSTAVADGKSYQDSASVQSDQALKKTLEDTYSVLKIATQGYAEALGLNADQIKSRADQINFAMGKDAQETQANITKMFNELGDSMANSLGFNLSKFAQNSETASSTLARLATDISSTNEWFGKLHLQIYALNETGITGAESLIKASGGLQALQQNASTYYDNFFSEEEKRANVTKQLTDEFAKANLGTLPATREAFRALVEQMNKTGTQEQVAALLKMSGAFADITASAQTAAQVLAESQQQIMVVFNGSLQDIKAAQSLLSNQRLAEVAGRRAIQQQDDVQRKQAAQAQADRFAALPVSLRDLLRNGDQAGVAAAQQLAAMPDASQYVKNGQYIAGAFNAALERGTKQWRLETARMASSDALNVPGVMRYISDVNPSAYAQANLQQSRANMAQNNGLDPSGTIAAALSGLFDAAITRSNLQNLHMGQGIGGVNSAQWALDFAQYRDTGMQQDVAAYASSVALLKEQFKSGRLSSDDYSKALNVANELLDTSSDLYRNEAAQLANVQRAREALVAAGYDSIKYYFGSIADAVAGIEAAARKAEAPLAKVSLAIGRMQSVSAVFGQSANAAQSFGNYQADTMVQNARIVSDAANRLSVIITTADAKAAQQALTQSAAFSAMSEGQLRDTSLLLDGLREYDTQALETGFLRITDALAAGKVNQQQYQTLLDYAANAYSGELDRTVNKSAIEIADSFKKLKEQMQAFGASLLIDKQTTTLTDTQQQQELMRQYAQAYSLAAKGGDADISNYQTLARTVLDKTRYDSQAEYNAVFGRVVGDTAQLERVGAVNSQKSSVVDELRTLNKDLSERVKQLEDNLTLALAQIARNTAKTSQGVDQLAMAQA